MNAPRIRDLGMQDYVPVWRRMQSENAARDAHTRDEIWFLQHPPVFTLGLNGKPEHVLAAGDIPVVNIDRGGQVTYHGPGQIVVYPLLDLRRLKLGVRALVMALEQSVIDTLAGYGIEAAARRDAPGVYVDGAKIAALGLRIRHGCTYHGLAFNVAMDLAPFSRINPCGYAGLEVTQVADLGGPADVSTVVEDLKPHLLKNLGYGVSGERLAVSG
ncbi:MAG TPA: lipoyl(octanoyl) transferase LipB [Gammaproteobacteria bacterium]|jgi:lipoyl(octanoyl) transferase|nr:lipoyl(octanoyl) transferase LipB [Gammaproteobacteria bacterium]